MTGHEVRVNGGDDEAPMTIYCSCGWAHEVVVDADPTPAELWATEQAHLADVGQAGAPTPVPVHHARLPVCDYQKGCLTMETCLAAGHCRAVLL